MGRGVAMEVAEGEREGGSIGGPAGRQWNGRGTSAVRVSGRGKDKDECRRRRAARVGQVQHGSGVSVHVISLSKIKFTSSKDSLSPMVAKRNLSWQALSHQKSCCPYSVC